MSTRRALDVSVETFAVDGEFVISRGRRTETRVVHVAVAQATRVGHGEGVPYAHYGESVQSVQAQIEGVRTRVEAGLDRQALIRILPAGAARAALDAALWDLECALEGQSIEQLVGRELRPVQTVRTISLGEPMAMADQARALVDWPILKLKLGASGDEERVRAVRRAAPGARLVVDANEGWQAHSLEILLEVMCECGVEMVEQPLPPAEEEALANCSRHVPIGADESFHTIADLDRAARLYDFVNLKLDKTGGLTHALEIADRLADLDLRMMVGCMLGTSLGMAPALVLAQRAELVDLDAPYLLAEDREPGLRLGATGQLEHEPRLWGGG